MKEITREFALENNLKSILTISDGDMSKVTLAMERLKEDKRIKYYTMDLIIFNQQTHEGSINLTFWGD